MSKIASITSEPAKLLAGELASQAEFIVNTLNQTHYQYEPVLIDPDLGIYDCDCSTFVGFLLEGLAPNHYAMIKAEDHVPRPRAFAYYTFLAALAAEPQSGWSLIRSLQEARRGDIIAWELTGFEPGDDTGHVVYVAETPRLLDSGFFAVRVYDSANFVHFDDTRGDGPDQFPNGVGSGFINFEVDDSGAPTGFVFGPSGHLHNPPIAIGRAEAIAE